ncbi:MAG TPA: AAA family ATPase [Acidimicrobiales bacterium]|nr:AAA family ATPase [Acidimicrobiales bacterium]
MQDVFVGRKAELARFGDVMARVRGGQPCLVTIEGDSGVGKTALARRCLASSPELTVLWARADQSESDLDYGVVGQLLYPLARREGTEGTFLANSTSSSSPFAVGARLLGFVGDQLAAGPVAVVIDDVQWADRSSVEALSFMFRRLTVDPVVVVVLVRGQRDRLDEPTHRMLLSIADCQRMAISGLSIDDVASLADALAATPLDAGGIERLYRHTGGHPLYLQTVLGDTEAMARTGLDGADVPSSLAAAIGDQLAVLPAATRSLLEMLAVVNAPVPLAALGEAAEVESPSTAVEAAVAAGLADLWPHDLSRHVVIRHPLQRDAVYAGIGAARQRELHARAVGLVDETSAWAHRVASLERPDESLALELERLAGQDALDGHFVRAATRLKWAAGISSSHADRERRMLTAAFHLTVADEARVLALRPAVEASAPCALRSCTLATMAFSAGELAETERRFKEAFAQVQSEPDSELLAALIANRLAATYTVLGEGERATELAKWALARECLGPAAVGRAHTSVAVGVAQTAGPRRALSELAHLDADPALVDPVEVDSLCWRGVCRLLTGDLGGAISDMTAALAMVRNGATVTLGLRAYAYLALAQYLAGQWDDALITAEQGLSVAAVRPRRPELPLMHLAAGCIAAGRGLADDAEGHASAAEEVASSLTYSHENVYAAMARALVCQASGDYLGMSDALGLYRDDSALDARSRLFAVLWRPLLVEGLVGSGQLGLAADALDWLRADGAKAPSLRPALLWLEGWLAEHRSTPEEALQLYQLGEGTDASGSPVYRARLLLAHGRLLRRLGQRRPALDALRQAHDLYLGWRAAPFIARTEAELTKCGLRQQSAKQRSVLDMTARETEVAHLVAQDMTNAEIGAELFITPKAVEYHLSNLYAKLGLKGRKELRRFLLASRRPAPA